MSCNVNTEINLEKVHNSECQQTIQNRKFLEIAEWSQSQLSIRGQPGTSTFGGQERKHAMRFLFATIQRQSKYDIKGESISTLLVSHSEYPRDKPFLLTPVALTLARANQPFWLNRPGQLAGNSERACGI